MLPASNLPMQDSLFTICHLPFTHPYSMRRAIYPGFIRRPVTTVIWTSSSVAGKLFDEIIIAILVNPDKQPFFSIEERRDMLEKCSRASSSAIASYAWMISRDFWSTMPWRKRRMPSCAASELFQTTSRIADGLNESQTGTEHRNCIHDAAETLTLMSARGW